MFPLQDQTDQGSGEDYVSERQLAAQHQARRRGIGFRRLALGFSVLLLGCYLFVATFLMTSIPFVVEARARMPYVMLQALSPLAPRADARLILDQYPDKWPMDGSVNQDKYHQGYGIDVLASEIGHGDTVSFKTWPCGQPGLATEVPWPPELARELLYRHAVRLMVPGGECIEGVYEVTRGKVVVIRDYIPGVFFPPHP